MLHISEILGFRTLSIVLVLKNKQTLMRIWNNLLCTFFLLALMDLAWPQVFITRVICDIGCPVIEASSF
jgi:hypothetical protein